MKKLLQKPSIKEISILVGIQWFCIVVTASLGIFLHHFVSKHFSAGLGFLGLAFGSQLYGSSRKKIHPFLHSTTWRNFLAFYATLLSCGLQILLIFLFEILGLIDKVLMSDQTIPLSLKSKLTFLPLALGVTFLVSFLLTWLGLLNANRSVAVPKPS